MARLRGSTGIEMGRGTGPLLFLTVVLSVMIGAMIWFHRSVPAPEPVPIVTNASETPVPGYEEDFIAWDPLAQSWGKIADSDAVGMAETPAGALAKAVERVAARPWAQFKLYPSKLFPDRPGFLRLNVPELVADTARLRGQPFELLGRLVSLEEVDLFDLYRIKLPNGGTKVYDGIIRTRASLHGAEVPVRFTMMHSLAQPLPRVGAHVKLQGVFFKRHMLQLDGEARPGLWLLGVALHRSFYLPPADEIDLTGMSYVEDASTAEDASRHIFAEPTLFSLMSYVLHREDEIRAAPIPMRGTEVQDLLHDPDRYRGEVIEFQARVIRVEEHPMDAFFPQNAAGDNAIDRIWNTYVTADGHVPITVLWVKKPALDLTVADQVRVRGIFYRNWGYRAAKGMVRAPLLVGVGDIVKVEIGSSGFDLVAWGLVAFGVIVGTLVFVVLRVDRRRSELFRRTLTAKKQVQRGTLDLNRVARDADGEAAEAPPESSSSTAESVRRE